MHAASWGEKPIVKWYPYHFTIGFSGLPKHLKIRTRVLNLETGVSTATGASGSACVLGYPGTLNLVPG